MSPTIYVLAGALLVAFALVAGLWVLITSLLAGLSGWPRLAEAFPGGPVPDGERLRGLVLGIGPVRENNVTVLVATPQGLYLYPMVLFRIRRPPLLVPWARIHYVEPRQLLGFRWHVIDLGGVTTIRVRPRLLPRLALHGVFIPTDALAGA